MTSLQRKVARAEKPKRNLKGRPGRRPGKNPCGRNALGLMAKKLRQVFGSGIVRNLSKGVSRPTQSLWARKICEALHCYDFSGMEIVTVYLNHEYERSLTTE